MCPYDLGSQNFADCDNSVEIGCNWLGKMAVASEEMLEKRAEVSTNKNFLIANHYPQNRKLLNKFKAARDPDLIPNNNIWSIFGHHVCMMHENVFTI